MLQLTEQIHHRIKNRTGFDIRSDAEYLIGCESKSSLHHVGHSLSIVTIYLILNVQFITLLLFTFLNLFFLFSFCSQHIFTYDDGWAGADDVNRIMDKGLRLRNSRNERLCLCSRSCFFFFFYFCFGKFHEHNVT